MRRVKECNREYITIHVFGPWIFFGANARLVKHDLLDGSFDGAVVDVRAKYVLSFVSVIDGSGQAL
jgi:hypothetical protein